MSYLLGFQTKYIWNPWGIPFYPVQLLSLAVPFNFIRFLISALWVWLEKWRVIIDARVTTSLGNRTVQSFAVGLDIPSKLSRTVALADPPVGENRIPLHFGYLPKGVVGSCIHCYFLGNYCLWEYLSFPLLRFTPSLNWIWWTRVASCRLLLESTAPPTFLKLSNQIIFIVKKLF